MIISHNIPALMTHLSMKKSNRGLAASMQRLASGFRINSAKEDATGLAVANKLSYQIANLTRASENASHGVALVQTAEGALSEVTNMLQRMRELAVQAAHGTLLEADKNLIQMEIDQLVDEIQAISVRTEYNKMKILNGEGARIMESVNPATGDTDTAISTLLYISDAVQPGSMTYTITDVGRPAQLNGVAPTLADGATVVQTGAFTINGISVSVTADDTFNSVRAKMLEACNFAGIGLWSFGGATILTTHLAGSNQSIDIQGNAALLAQFGLVPTDDLPPGTAYSPGTDAVISDMMLTDMAGQTLASQSAGSISYRATGNQIVAVGIRGEQIRFNLQVINQTDPAVALGFGGLVFGDGTPIGIAGTPGGLGLDMAFDFKDYGPLRIQVGGSYNNNVSMHIPKMSAETLGFIEFKGGREYKLLNYCTTQGASEAIGKVDQALDMVSHVRSRLGAFQNRLDATVRSLDIAVENTELSHSRIIDTDMAREMTRYSQLNVMYQAGLAILGQANMRPQQVLSLLQ